MPLLDYLQKIKISFHHQRQQATNLMNMKAIRAKELSKSERKKDLQRN
jgi:hypothetical protein